VQRYARSRLKRIRKPVGIRYRPLVQRPDGSPILEKACAAIHIGEVRASRPGAVPDRMAAMFDLIEVVAISLKQVHEKVHRGVRLVFLFSKNQGFRRLENRGFFHRNRRGQRVGKVIIPAVDQVAAGCSVRRVGRSDTGQFCCGQRDDKFFRELFDWWAICRNIYGSSFLHRACAADA